MIFTNLPSNYKSISLSNEEAAAAIGEWLSKTHPNLMFLEVLDGRLDVAVKIKVTVNGEAIDAVAYGRDEHAPTTLEIPKASRRRLNAGIGKPLVAIFADGAVHNLTDVYATLKPSFPYLTRAKLQHNFYPIEGMKNLGDNKWQVKLPAAIH